MPDPTQIHYHLPPSPRHPNVSCRHASPLCGAAAAALPAPGRCASLGRAAWLARPLRASRCSRPQAPAHLPVFTLLPRAAPRLLLAPRSPPPQGWQVKVWRDYERFLADLTALFPHEAAGIRGLYDEFWKVGGPWSCGWACRVFGRRPAGPPTRGRRTAVANVHNTLPPPPPPPQVFNALNTLELKSLEEPRYLLEQVGGRSVGGRLLAVPPWPVT